MPDSNGGGDGGFVAVENGGGRKVSKGLGFYPSVSLEKTLASGGGEVPNFHISTRKQVNSPPSENSDNVVKRF